MKILCAKITDFENVFKIFYESIHRNSRKKLVKNYKKKWKNLFINSLKKGVVLVAKEREQTVGFLISKFEISTSPIFIKEKQIFIDELAVDKEHRNKGIGARLVKTALKISAKKGAVEARLAVFSDNPRAVNFYKKNGFKEEMKKMIKKL